MTVQIKLFAGLAEAEGWRTRRIDHTPGLTVQGVWLACTGSALPRGRVLCALNMDYCAPEQAVRDGDEVAFFPPVTGGGPG